MEKIRGESMSMKQKYIEGLEGLIPNCITEEKDKNGKYHKIVNLRVLKQMLSDNILEGIEAYEFTWVGKKASIIEANKATSKILRPCEEESVSWNLTENLYIEGDNLEVLKILQESCLGKIKVIYIDPPYNTGNNLIYRNDFSEVEEDYYRETGGYDEDNNHLYINTKSNGRFHSDWCSMIYPRLLCARNLLSDDGIIVLTIDDSEIENVTAIMNEVFGEENHLATVVIKNNPSGRSTVKGFSINHEYALFYAKTNMATLGRLKHSTEQKARYKEKDKNGYYEWENFRKNGTDSNRGDRPKQFFPIVLNTDDNSLRIPELIWDDEKKRYNTDIHLSDNEIILLPISQGVEKVWKYGINRTRSIINQLLVKQQKGAFELYRKKYINEEGSLPRTWWDKPEYSARDNGTRTLTNLFGPVKLFDFPKAPEAVKDALVAANLQNDDIVLDFFSGSATTAQAVMELNAEDGGNRKFIMVQLPEKCEEKSEAYKAGYKTICDIGKERIRRAAKKIHEEHPDAQFDDGFRVFKVDSSNMTEVGHTADDMTQDLLSQTTTNIKADRTDLDLLFDCLLKEGVEITYPYSSETIDGCTVHDYNNGALIACFDENVTETVMREMAKRKPIRAIFRDSSFKTDADRINVEEIFKLLSPDTTVKVI